MIPLHPHGSPIMAQHRFNVVPDADIERSVLDRSSSYKTTFNAGYLIPFYNDFAYPGDTFKVSATVLARLATQISPFMDNLYLDTHFFAVPVRLLQANWQKLNGEQDNPGDSTDYLSPVMANTTSTSILEQTIGDYFGFPIKVAGLSGNSSSIGGSGANWPISSFPFRAYNRIYNDWFRDENLINSLTVETDDGPDPWANYSLQRRGKRKDYFTGSLPWPQKGTAISLPLGTSAPLGGSIADIYNFSIASPAYVQLRAAYATGGGNLAVGDNTNPVGGGVGNGYRINLDPAGQPDAPVAPYADLTNATAATINSLRLAFQLQRLLERDARGGTRLIEVIRAQFGVTSDDARMQRSEYIGGGTTQIATTPIPQTSSPVTGNPASTLSALSTAAGGGHSFSRSFTEHCVIIGLMSIRQDYTYQQGSPRIWANRARFDYYWPALAHIGEQPVYQAEIYATGTSSYDQTIFGYQEAYAYMRYKPSQITGLLRSTATGSLDLWHLAQDFGSAPTLGQTFIEENPPLSRVIATSNLFGTAQFVADIFMQESTTRPMPVYAVPGYIDHF